MLFNNVSDLTIFIKQYCSQLYKKIDDELVPQILLIEDYDQLKLFEEMSGIYLSAFLQDSNMHIGYALQFESKALDSYYKVPSSSGLPMCSLLDSIHNQMIGFINQCLYNYVNTEEIYEISFSGLLRQSGKTLLQAILCNDFINNPFEKINKISSLSYEKSFSEGKILLLNEDVSKALELEHIIKPLVQFDSKIPLSSYRHIRKILELSTPDVYLLSDGEYLYSTVEFALGHDPNFHFFTIEFNNYFSWQLNHNNNKLMQVTHEEVYIPKPKISYLSFSAEFKKIFPDTESKKILNIYRLVLEALKQIKGTIIVISKNARSESYRLRNQGFLIESLYLTPTTIHSITCIDGAVLMDIDGFCHGIGVILDGIATEKGDPSRGARFNSAVRYVETITKTLDYSNCFAIVISEDGDVDMISQYLY